MAGDSEYKQLLDVSRTLSEVASELKKTNKDLAAIAKTVSKDLPSEIKKVADSQKQTTKSIAEYQKASAGDKAGDKAAAPKAGGAEAEKGREILKAFGLEDFMGLYEEELAKLSAAKTKSVKGALKNGGTIKEGGNYIVGENGAEVVNVPKGTNVVPLNVSDLLDGLSKIGEIKKLINKDGMLNVEVSGGDKILIGDSPTDRYSLESIKKSIKEEQAENSARGITDKSGADKLTILDSLNKKIEAGAALPKPGSSSASTIDEMIAKKGGIDKTTLNDFYPSKQEMEQYKARLIREEPELAADVDGLNYELERFKVEEADRRYQQAMKKEGTAVTAKSESKPTLETIVKKGPETEKSEGAKGRKEKTKVGEKLKSGLSKIIAGTLSGTSFENAVGFGDSKKIGVSNITQLASSASSSLLPKIATKSSPASSSKAENKTPSLSLPKKTEPQPQPQTNETQSSPSPAQDKSEPAPQSTATSETSKSPEKSSSGSQSNQSSGSEIKSKDLDEIKALLASMARSLSGPLNIYNPDPFRPDSRRI